MNARGGSSRGSGHLSCSRMYDIPRISSECLWDGGASWARNSGLRIWRPSPVAPPRPPMVILESIYCTINYSMQIYFIPRATIHICVTYYFDNKLNSRVKFTKHRQLGDQPRAWPRDRASGERRASEHQRAGIRSHRPPSWWWWWYLRERCTSSFRGQQFRRSRGRSA